MIVYIRGELDIYKELYLSQTFHCVFIHWMAVSCIRQYLKEFFVSWERENTQNEIVMAII